MPCVSEPPSQSEITFEKLRSYMKETGVSEPASRKPWSQAHLDSMTRLMCDFCKTHDVREYSLELQIWWRDHQEWDRKRREAKQRASERERLIASALSKLTKEEKESLLGS